MWYAWIQFLLALAIWREARGEGEEGMQAVGCVLRNNLKGQLTIEAWSNILLHPFFISSLTAINDPEERKWPQIDDKQFEDAYHLAVGIYGNTIPDNTNGATHYFNPSVILPDWAKKMAKVCTIGHHDFYK